MTDTGTGVIEESTSSYGSNLEVINIDDLPPLLHFNESVEDEVELFNMTSLATLMMLDRATSRNSSECEDEVLQRLSLAYERLHSMPKILLQEVAPTVKILDISYNEFENLDFLKEFKELTSLICDHNNITSDTYIPYMPKLELLWLNHCKIEELYCWAWGLYQSCPNLKYLSLMGNIAAPSYLNGGGFYEYLHYRLYVISIFPKLVHLDDKAVTEDQRSEALKVYKRPLIERIMSGSANVPAYFKSFSTSFSKILTTSSEEGEKNLII